MFTLILTLSLTAIARQGTAHPAIQCRKFYIYLSKLQDIFFCLESIDHLSFVNARILS